jgi:hypothetical protein
MTLKVRVIPCLPVRPQRQRREDGQNQKNVEAGQ